MDHDSDAFVFQSKKNLFFLFLGSLSSCLEFGEDFELKGVEITGKELQDISAKTDIEFPQGTEPVGYCFWGSGIDRSLVFKAVIPEDQKEEFLKNDIFTLGHDSKFDNHFAKHLDWWNVDELTEKTDRNLELPKLKYVECTVGLEDGKIHVYVTWFEI